VEVGKKEGGVQYYKFTNKANESFFARYKVLKQVHDNLMEKIELYRQEMKDFKFPGKDMGRLASVDKRSKPTKERVLSFPKWFDKAHESKVLDFILDELGVLLNLNFKRANSDFQNFGFRE